MWGSVINGQLLHALCNLRSSRTPALTQDNLFFVVLVAHSEATARFGGILARVECISKDHNDAVPCSRTKLNRQLVRLFTEPHCHQQITI